MIAIFISSGLLDGLNYWLFDCSYNETSILDILIDILLIHLLKLK